MLSDIKHSRLPLIKTVWCTLVILLLACGLIAVIQNVGETTITTESSVAESTGNANFRTMSPYVPGGRFGAVQY